MKTQVHLSVVWCVFIVFFLVLRSWICWQKSGLLSGGKQSVFKGTILTVENCTSFILLHYFFNVQHSVSVTYIHSLFKMPKITNIYLLKNENNYSKSTLKGNVEVNPIKHSLTNKIRIKMNKMPTSKVFACKNKSTSSRMYSK